MKKIFALLLCWLMVGGKAVAFDDIPDAKQFGFNQQYVIEVFMEHIAPEYPLENTSDQKQQKKNLEAALKKYNALSANGENKISAVDFLDVCAAGGLKVKQSVGYSDCLSIFSELIDLQNMDDGGFNMFCPATYDENGKQLNRLKSLDENTMVGDDCSSTNIAYGVVTIRKPGASGQDRYACTCLAMSCGVHPKASQGWHYVLEGGQCKESAVGADGFCVRQEFDLSPTNGPNQYIDKTQFYKRGSALYAQYVEQGEEKCDAYAAKGKCKYKRLVMNISTDGNKVSLVCNPTEEEAVSVHENIKQSREQAEAKIREDKLRNLKYRAVCAQKSRAKNEICVGDVFTRKFFGGIQVDVGSAKILVKEWARNNGYREIECSNEEPRTVRVVAGAKDYGIQCASLDVDKDGNRAYFEFLFDDVVESWDNVIMENIETAIVEKIYKQKLVRHASYLYDTIFVEPNGEQVCKNMTDTFSKIYKDEYTYYYGKYSPSLAFYPSDSEPYCRIRKPEHKRELNTAFGINPLMFCKNEHQQLRNDGNIEKALQEYISTVSGVSVANIDCTGAVQYKKYCGWDRKWGDCKCKYASFSPSDPGDDIKTCTVYDGETTHKIDFVFDDFSEWSTKLSETSFDAVQCVIAGEKINITRQMLGTLTGEQAKLIDTHNEGTKCAGLTKDMCEGPGSLDEVLRKNGHSGAYYDESKRACILVSAEEYRTQELGKDIGIGTVVTIGVAVAAYFSGGSVLIIGGVFGGVDLATNVSFYLVEEQKEYRPARKFEGFVKNAKLCKDSDCAFKTIQKYYSDLNANASQFNDDDLQYMGAELDRLFGMIETDACYVDQNGNVLHQPENMNDCSRKVLLQLKSTDMGWEVADLSIIAGSFVDPESGILKVFSKSGRIARMLKGADKLTKIKNKALKDFDMHLFNVTDGGFETELRISKSNLTDEEWKILEKDLLDKHGLVMTFDTDGFVSVHPDYIALKNKVNENFDFYLEQCLSGGECVAFSVAGLSASEWRQVKKYVEYKGAGLKEEVIEKGGKRIDVMRLEKYGINVHKKDYAGYNSIFETDIGNYLSRSNTLKDLNSQGRLDFRTSKSLNGKQYVRISMGENPDMQEATNLVERLQEEGFYVSSGTIEGSGEKFIGVSRENIFKPWEKEKGNWLLNDIGDVADADSVSRLAEIKNKALKDFDNSLNSLKNGDRTEFFVPKSNLTEEELAILVKDLQKEGLDVEEFGSALIRVKKIGVPTKPIPKGISGAYEKLDSEHREIVNRLNEFAGREDWEYKTAQELGSENGVYRIDLAHFDRTTEEEHVLVNKLEKANIKFRIETGTGRNKYLVISEQDIGDVGKIKPISVIMDEAIKNGSDFLGKLKGWKVDNVEQITGGIRNSVFKFKEINSGKTYYLKHAPDTDEVNRTKRAYEILNGKSDMVHTVKVVEDDQEVLIDFAAKNNLLKSSGEYWFLMEELPISKASWEMLGSKNSLKEVLYGKPITVAEQKEIRQAIDKLNSGGIVHGDLEHNMFFAREPNGKLQVYIIDYEKTDNFVSFVNDEQWLDETFDKFSKAGLAEDAKVADKAN